MKKFFCGSDAIHINRFVVLPLFLRLSLYLSSMLVCMWMCRNCTTWTIGSLIVCSPCTDTQMLFVPFVLFVFFFCAISSIDLKITALWIEVNDDRSERNPNNSTITLINRQELMVECVRVFGKQDRCDQISKIAPSRNCNPVYFCDWRVRNAIVDCQQDADLL